MPNPTPKPILKSSPAPQTVQDILKFLCLFGTIGGCFTLFWLSPGLSEPTLLSLLVMTLLSPAVSALERCGYSRTWSITLVFLMLGTTFGLLGSWAFHAGQNEWFALKNSAPIRIHSIFEKIQAFEDQLKTQYSFLQSIQIKTTLQSWEDETLAYFSKDGVTWVGRILTWTVVVPPLSFVFLNEGRNIKRKFFQLVPNRFFESFFLMTTHITQAISDYVQAKLIEAFLVGLLVTVGLMMIGSPYSLVLGIIAGITNIIPYLGPVVGLIPGILMTGLYTQTGYHPVAFLSVYLVANVIDTVIIFPVLVAKLVDLHPLLLIIAVGIGQQYYGLTGMLISTPLAAAFKVILTEVYTAIYAQKVARHSFKVP